MKINKNINKNSKHHTPPPTPTGDYGDYNYATDISLLVMLIVLMAFASVMLGM